MLRRQPEKPSGPELGTLWDRRSAGVVRCRGSPRRAGIGSLEFALPVPEGSETPEYDVHSQSPQQERHAVMVCLTCRRLILDYTSSLESSMVTFTEPFRANFRVTLLLSCAQ